jgi:hypothetical protein
LEANTAQGTWTHWENGTTASTAQVRTKLLKKSTVKMVPLFYISRLFVESDSIQYRCDDHFTTSPGQVRALHMLTHALIVIRGFRKELGNNVVISKKPFLSQISASIKMRKINDKLVFKKNFIFC